MNIPAKIPSPGWERAGVRGIKKDVLPIGFALSCPGSAWAQILRQSPAITAVPGRAWDGAGYMLSGEESHETAEF
jgi:hypothetical protein